MKKCIFLCAVTFGAVCSAFCIKRIVELGEENRVLHAMIKPVCADTTTVESETIAVEESDDE